MGICTAIGLAPRRSRIRPAYLRRKRPARSILLTKADAGDVVAVRLPPDRLGLGFDALNGVEYHNTAVEHAQAALHLSREVDVARGVNDVDDVVTPIGGHGR